MLRNWKWARVVLMALMMFALLSGGLAWAGKPPKLADPKNLDSSTTATSITLTWETGGVEDGFIVGYLEDVFPDPQCTTGIVKNVGTATSFLVEDLTAGATYGFRVCAYNATTTTNGATLLVTLGGGGSSGPEYTITWLNEFESNYATCINSLGHVGGLAESPDKYGGEPFAFVYTPATGMVDLNTLLPVSNDWHLRNANDINDKGQIVGLGYRTGSDKGRGWLYTPASLNESGLATIQELAPPLADDLQTNASKINEWGDVLGRTMDASGVSHVWLFSDGNAVPVFSPTVGTTANTRGLNTWGQSLIYTNPASVLVSPDGEPTYFDDVFECWGLNDSGHFAASKAFDIEVPINKKRTEIKTVVRAIRHDGVAALDLGAGDDSWGRWVNNSGDVVGCYGYDRMYRAWVYLDEFERVVDLDDVVVGDAADLLLWDAAGAGPISYPKIHNTGQIIGYVPNPSPLPGMSGFILTPVPPEE